MSPPSRPRSALIFIRSRMARRSSTLNATQPDLILAAIRKMPDEGKIINAVDNDDGGDRLTILLNDMVDSTGSAKPSRRR